MKKTLDLKSNDTEYILVNTNPNEKRSPFTIDKSTMEFNTTEFYEYVFADIDKELDIQVNNLVPETDKLGQRTFSTIVEICDGVNSKMKEKCF